MKGGFSSAIAQFDFAGLIPLVDLQSCVTGLKGTAPSIDELKASTVESRFLAGTPITSASSFKDWQLIGGMSLAMRFSR